MVVGRARQARQSVRSRRCYCRAEYTEQREHGRDAQACQQPLLRHDESNVSWKVGMRIGGAQYDARKFEIAPCWYFAAVTKFSAGR